MSKEALGPNGQDLTGDCLIIIKHMSGRVILKIKYTGSQNTFPLNSVRKSINRLKNLTRGAEFYAVS